MPIVDTSIIKEFELFDVYQKENDDPVKNLVFALCQSWKGQNGRNDMVWMEMDPQPKAKMILDFLEIVKSKWPEEKVVEKEIIKEVEKIIEKPVEVIKEVEKIVYVEKTQDKEESVKKPTSPEPLEQTKDKEVVSNIPEKQVKNTKKERK